MITDLAALDSSFLRSMPVIKSDSQVLILRLVSYHMQNISCQIPASTIYTWIFYHKLFGCVYSKQFECSFSSRAPGSWCWGFIIAPCSSLQLAEHVKTHRPVLAVLMVIGGLDTGFPRTHIEFGDTLSSPSR